MCQAGGVLDGTAVLLGKQLLLSRCPPYSLPLLHPRLQYDKLQSELAAAASQASRLAEENSALRSASPAAGPVADPALGPDPLAALQVGPGLADGWLLMNCFCSNWPRCCTLMLHAMGRTAEPPAPCSLPCPRQVARQMEALLAEKSRLVAENDRLLRENTGLQVWTAWQGRCAAGGRCWGTTGALFTTVQGFIFGGCDVPVA